MNSTTLNDKEQKVLEYIKEQIKDTGYPPSVREICAALGFKSTSSAHQYIWRLAEKGYIDNDEYLQLVKVFTPFSNDEMLALINTKDFKTRIEMYLSVLERGYRIASEYYDIQIDKLLELHRQFREGGYKHEWLFKKKPIKEYGIYVFFNCYFTTIDFRLELEVYDIKKTQLLTKGVVFRTAPDRIHFGKDFNKGIEIDNDKMYLLDFLEKRAFEFDLDKLSKGEFNVIQLSEVRDYTEIIDRINWLK